MPIIYRGTDHGEGSFGDVYKVKIHYAHLVLDPPPVSLIQAPSTLPHAEGPETEKNEPLIAIKQLKSDLPKEFQQEYDALYKIQSLGHDHLIKVIDSFKRGQSYFFLFLWAEGGDLKQAWRDKNTEFRTIEMIRWVFAQMKGLASGVRRLHNYSDAENGRHGDLRPENILLFLGDASNPRGTLRITDVGLARFHTEITSRRLAGTVTTGGSIMYAPPEALREGTKRSRKYDLWSLGCIFLEFTIWALGGVDKVEQFQRARTTDRTKHAEYFFTNTSRSRKPLAIILPEVCECIKTARNDSQCQGSTAFSDLLNLIDKHLLRVDDRDRLDAAGLDDRLGDILKNAQGNLSYLFNGSSANGGFEPKAFPRGKLLLTWAQREKNVLTC